MKLLLPCGPMICPSAFCAPMPYTGVSSDLNTFLIAIAATSAAIIAILGGLIFGRYLPAVNDRESGKARLKRLKNDLMEKKLQAIEKTTSHNEMFPLYYLCKNVDVIMYGKKQERQNAFLKLMEPLGRESYSFSPTEMQRYCETALNAWDAYRALVVDEINDTDESLVPKALMDTYNKGTPKYDVISTLAPEFKKGYYRQVLHELLVMPSYESELQKYEDAELEINKLKADMESREAEILDLGEELSLQKKPQLMPLGLALFASYAFFCVILPLVFIVMVTAGTELGGTTWVEALFVAMFSVFLILTFVYLAFIMRWGKTLEENVPDKTGEKSVKTSGPLESGAIKPTISGSNKPITGISMTESFRNTLNITKDRYISSVYFYDGDGKQKEYSRHEIPVGKRGAYENDLRADTAGVYFFIGTPTDEKSDNKLGIYIGVSEHWGQRIAEKHGDVVDDWLKTHLQRIFVFSPVDDTWDEDDLLYIEDKFYQMAKRAGPTTIWGYFDDNPEIIGYKETVAPDIGNRFIELDVVIKEIVSDMVRHGYRCFEKRGAYGSI